MIVWQLTVVHSGETRNYFTEAVDSDTALSLLKKAYEIPGDAEIKITQANKKALTTEDTKV